GVVIEFNLSFDFYLGGCIPPRIRPLTDEAVDIKLSGQRVADVSLEPLSFGEIQLQGSKAVGEVESIHNHACIVAEGIGFDDIHPPAREHASDFGKQARPIWRYDRQLEPMLAFLEIELDGIVRETVGHSHMTDYFL